MNISKGWFLKMSLVNKTIKRKAGLTSRQKAMIEILVKNTSAKPVTISFISEKLGLSSRTILREMPSIEKWLYENEFHLVRRPGVGIILEETAENKQLILELLEVEEIKKEYSKQERRRLLLGELLSSKEPLKSYYFTSKYGISDGTLSNDLDSVSQYLLPYHIEVVRRQGLGIYLEGKESDFRMAIASVLYDTLDEKEIIELISGKEEKFLKSEIGAAIESRLLNLIDLKTIQSIENVLLKAEEKLNIKYTDSGYIGLIVHLSLAMKRIENHETISMDKSMLEQLQELPEFSIAAEIVRSLKEVFHLQIPEDETGYITMHLKGAKLRLKNKNGEISMADINMNKIANQITSYVEQSLGVDLKGNSTLIEDLSNHLMPAVSRLSMNLNIKNPQLETIKQNYTTVFHATKEACSLLKDIIQIKEIPESEIAYIAMYFCAALEKKRTERMFSVVIVCPTGMGTSKLLAVNVGKEFHNIEVKDIISALNINSTQLKKNGIDFIISTVELTIDFTNICVSPFLLPQDKILIQNLIAQLERKKKEIQPEEIETAKKRRCNKEDILYCTKLGEEIVFILNHIRLFEVQSVKNLSHLIQEAAIVFAETMEETEYIVNAMTKREEIANTYIEEYKMFLLHCNCPFYQHCCFGVLRVKQSFYWEGREVKGGIIMIAPQGGNPMYPYIMSEISAALIENEALTEAVIHKGQNHIVKEVEKKLGSYYFQTITKRWEMLCYD